MTVNARQLLFNPVAVRSAPWFASGQAAPGADKQPPDAGAGHATMEGKLCKIWPPLCVLQLNNLVIEMINAKEVVINVSILLVMTKLFCFLRVLHFSLLGVASDIRKLHVRKRLTL